MIKWLSVLVLALQASAATYYVNGTTGNDANDGSLANPWRRIGKAATNMVAGDTVLISAFNYGERVWPQNSGTPGSKIYYIGDLAVKGTNYITLGFELIGKSNIVVAGLEMTHTNTTFENAVNLDDAARDNIIERCYIHDIHEAAMAADVGCTARFMYFRDNEVYWMQHPGGAYAVGNGAIIGNYTSGNTHDWVIENNRFIRSADFLNLYGSNSVARGNLLYDSNTPYWVTNGFHADGFQAGSDTAQVFCRNQNVERNGIFKILDQFGGPDGHAGIWQDTPSPGFGDNVVRIRGNAASEFGSGGFASLAMDNVKMIFNSLNRPGVFGAGGGLLFYGTGQTSTNGWIANNGLTRMTNIADAILMDTGHTGTITNNAGLHSNAETSYVTTADPLHVDPNNYDLRIGSSSPWRDAGTTNLLWITSATGSGTSFDVNDVAQLSDGAGLTEGDRITINGTTTRVVSISGPTVTVRDSVTWTQNDGIIWDDIDSKPDIGAYPYGMVPLTAGTYVVVGNEYRVTPTGNARGVRFYVDGKSTHWIYETTNGTYNVTISSGTVVPVVYARYAPTPTYYPTVVATLDGGGGSGIPHRGKIGNNIRLRSRL